MARGCDSLLLALLSLAHAVQAIDVSFGNCPDKQVVQNFDVARVSDALMVGLVRVARNLRGC